MHESIIASAVRDPKFLARFWAKVDKSGECWVWTAGKSSGGYGEVSLHRFAGRALQVKAHRIAWSSENGEIADGLCVLHRCDNPPCVRPSHLFIGTIADNNADKVSKGRCGDQRGEKDSQALLSEADVVSIRLRLAHGERQSVLAREFGVTQPTISDVATRRTWSHV